MSWINKERIYIWIIVGLLAVNISTIATISYHAYFKNSSSPVEVEQIDIPDDHLGRFFRDELNLNMEQHRKFRAYRQEFHNQATSLTSEMQDVRSRIIRELAAEESDSAALYQMAGEIGDMHKELKCLTYEYYLEMKSICTPEQKKKLFQIFNSMLTSEAEVIMPDMKSNFNKGQNNKQKNDIQ